MRRVPGQRGAGISRIDLIAEIVARPVAHEMDQARARAAGVRRDAVELGTDRVHHIDVAARLASADGVGPARRAAFDDAEQGGGVVLDVEPVARLAAIAVDGQRPALQRIENGQRG